LFPSTAKVLLTISSYPYETLNPFGQEEFPKIPGVADSLRRLGGARQGRPEAEWENLRREGRFLGEKAVIATP
jgi:hypothetical protein